MVNNKRQLIPIALLGFWYFRIYFSSIIKVAQNFYYQFPHELDANL